MTRTIECFYPGESFPAVSVTGRGCSLNCKHCSRKYLEGMIPATTSEELIDVAEALSERGAEGFLLSGGVDGTGRVPVHDLLPAIREIKSTTDLMINAHIGLTPKREIADLVNAGVDSFSVDAYGSDETVHDVLGIDARAGDYIDVMRNLHQAGARTVAPHICVGIHEGKLKGEFRAIESLKALAPKELVLISLIPTAGTTYERVSAPCKEMMLSTIRRAQDELPGTKLLLGCMRSKKDRSWECDLVVSGLDGIVLPSVGTVERLKREGYSIKKRSVCCSLP